MNCITLNMHNCNFRQWKHSWILSVWGRDMSYLVAALFDWKLWLLEQAFLWVCSLFCSCRPTEFTEDIVCQSMVNFALRTSQDFLTSHLVLSIMSDEQPKTQSWSTILWGLTIRLVSGYSPKLYSCQRSLPRMPVPPLQETIAKLMESIKPLYVDSEDKWAALQEEAEEFQKTIGPQLQWLLVFKSWWSPNYVSDWWYASNYKLIYCVTSNLSKANLDSGCTCIYWGIYSNSSQELHDFMIYFDKACADEIFMIPLSIVALGLNSPR